MGIAYVSNERKKAALAAGALLLSSLSLGGNSFADTMQTHTIFGKAPKCEKCLISLVSAEGLEPSTP